MIVVLRQASQKLGESEQLATAEGLVPWFAFGAGSREGKLVIVCNIDGSTLEAYKATSQRKGYVSHALLGFRGSFG